MSFQTLTSSNWPSKKASGLLLESLPPTVKGAVPFWIVVEEAMTVVPAISTPFL